MSSMELLMNRGRRVCGVELYNDEVRHTGYEARRCKVYLFINDHVRYAIPLPIKVGRGNQSHVFALYTFLFHFIRDLSCPPSLPSFPSRVIFLSLGSSYVMYVTAFRGLEVIYTGVSKTQIPSSSVGVGA